MNLFKQSNVKLTLVVVTVCALVLFSVSALAGTGGTEFDTVWTTLTDWMQGTLGRIATGTMILVGLIAGIARQSLMAFAVGIGGGVGLYNAPTIVDQIMTATLSHLPHAHAVVSFSNGLLH